MKRERKPVIVVIITVTIIIIIPREEETLPDDKNKRPVYVDLYYTAQIFEAPLAASGDEIILAHNNTRDHFSAHKVARKRQRNTRNLS